MPVCMGGSSRQSFDAFCGVFVFLNLCHSALCCGELTVSLCCCGVTFSPCPPPPAQHGLAHIGCHCPLSIKLGLMGFSVGFPPALLWVHECQWGRGGAVSREEGEEGQSWLCCCP